MKIKKIISLALVGVMTFISSACSTGGDTGSTSPDNTSSISTGNNGEGEKITVWAWDESFNIKAVNEAKEIYKDIDPNLEVEVVTMAQDDIVARLNTSLASGSYTGLPDIVLIEDYRARGYLNAYKNEFSDLSDIVLDGAFAEFKTGLSTIDGIRYSVPFDSGVAAVFYRLDLVEEAGYTKEDMENLTWDKYIEIGQKIKATSGVDLMTLDPNNGAQILMMLQSAGSWYTDIDENVDIANNQALKDAITTYKKLVDSDVTKVATGWDQFVGAFNSGEVASVPTGCWISASVQNGEDQSGNWAVTAFPKMAENSNSVNASSLGGSSWYVLKNVGNESNAKAFLKETFASSVELMDTLAEEINLVSTLVAAKDAKNYSKGIEFYGGQKLFSDLAKWTNEVPVVNYGENTYVIEDIITEAVQVILNGGDIDSTLEEYQKQIEAVVSR